MRYADVLPEVLFRMFYANVRRPPGNPQFRYMSQTRLQPVYVYSRWLPTRVAVDVMHHPGRDCGHGVRRKYHESRRLRRLSSSGKQKSTEAIYSNAPDTHGELSLPSEYTSCTAFVLGASDRQSVSYCLCNCSKTGDLGGGVPTTMPSRFIVFNPMAAQGLRVPRCAPPGKTVERSEVGSPSAFPVWCHAALLLSVQVPFGNRARIAGRRRSGY
jgi:hypothetical protein